MSRYSSRFLVILPLLSLMAIAPSDMKSSSLHRSPANAIEELNDSPYPKYEARAKKVDLKTLAVDKGIKLDDYFEKSKVMHERVSKEKKDFKKDIKDRADLEMQQKMLNEIVMDVVIQDVQLKELIGKKSFEQELSQQLAENTLKETKIILESMLMDVLDNELLVLRGEVIKKEEVVKKDEVKKEVVEEKKVEKKEEDIKKTELDNRICEIETKNKALMEQVNGFVSDQKKIIDTMLAMQQTMLGMQGQMMQSPPFTPYYAYPQTQQPIWQYQAQQPKADYSLLPQQSQQGQQQNLYQPNLYQNPQSMYQPIMGVNPQAYTEYDPRYSVTSNILPGAFGDQQMMFNFGGQQSNLMSMI